jgi:hypothetical protein
MSPRSAKGTILSTTALRALVLRWVAAAAPGSGFTSRLDDMMAALCCCSSWLSLWSSLMRNALAPLPMLRLRRYHEKISPRNRTASEQ